MTLFLRGSILYAQTRDTPDSLEQQVFFPRGESGLDFRTCLDYLQKLSDAQIRSVVIRTGASPEGPTAYNKELSEARARTIDAYLVDSLGWNPSKFTNLAVGEDWVRLAGIVDTLEVSWREDALTIIRDNPEFVILDGTEVDVRKNRLRILQGGEAWLYLDREVFPLLRRAKVTAYLERKEPLRDTVYVPVTVYQSDTVFLDKAERQGEAETAPAGKKRARTKVQDRPWNPVVRRTILAVRTNVLAVPFANLGVEVPLGRHVSLGADLYYPWIWRRAHSEGVDYQGWCFQFMAVDAEARYWFGRRHSPPGERLTGHSIGLYAAAGQYDFEWDYSGHQGVFYNIGVDYLYACPVFGGRLHLEFELGVGYICSPAQPYDTFIAGGLAYRRKGVQRIVRWWGPTRAQVSLVVPITVRK